MNDHGKKTKIVFLVIVYPNLRAPLQYNNNENVWRWWRRQHGNANQRKSFDFFFFLGGIHNTIYIIKYNRRHITTRSHLCWCVFIDKYRRTHVPNKRDRKTSWHVCLLWLLFTFIYLFYNTSCYLWCSQDIEMEGRGGKTEIFWLLIKLFTKNIVFKNENE